MRNYVIINGVNSLTIQGLAIKTLPPITKPIQRTLREEIDGRDGDIVTTLGYGAYDKTIEIGLFGTFDIDEVIAYFNQKGTITFSNEADKVYYFEALDQVDYAELLKFRTANVVLHCQPFKYPLNETPLVEEYEYIEATGTNVTLDNTSEAIFNKIELQGNTSQTTYTGKNLFDIANASTENANYTMTKNGNTFTSTKAGTGTSGSFYFKTNLMSVEANTDYVLSCTNFTTTTQRTSINVYAYSNSLWGNVIISNKRLTSTTPLTFNTGNNTTMLIGFFDEGQIEQGKSFTIKDLMLEKSSTATSYEPYVGGTASPNPSYPQQVNVVSGDNEINICGKNLLNIETTIPKRYVSYINGIVRTSDDWSVSDFIPIQGNTNYILSGITNSGWTAGTCFYDKDKTFISSVYTTVYSFTTPSSAKYVRLSLNSETPTNVMFEKGSTATTYEPYIGNSYPIYLGVENLFESEYIYPTTEASINAHLTKGTYTLSLEDKSNFGNVLYIQLYNGDTLVTTSGHITNASSSVAFSSSSYWYYFLNIPNGNYLTFTLDDNYNLKIAFSNATSTQKAQLERGSKANSFTPYGVTPIELCKIGTYQDYIYKEDGSWYLHKEIGKVVLDGSESWYVNNQTYRINNFGAKPFSSFSVDNVLAYSNYFKWLNGNSGTFVDGAMWYIFSGNELCLQKDQNPTSTTLATFKSWLSTHNTNLYYVLATPTNTLIEDTTLLEQLESLSMANSVQGQTNISQENNDLPFILSVSTLKDGSDHLVINNIGNIYAKPTLDLEGSGIVDIYLNDTQMFEVDLSETNEIVINTQEMEAYNPTTNALANRQVVGDYSKFKLDSGENDLRFSGALTKATITNYERWL